MSFLINITRIYLSWVCICLCILVNTYTINTSAFELFEPLIGAKIDEEALANAPNSYHLNFGNLKTEGNQTIVDRCTKVVEHIKNYHFEYESNDPVLNMQGRVAVAIAINKGIDIDSKRVQKNLKKSIHKISIYENQLQTVPRDFSIRLDQIHFLITQENLTHNLLESISLALERLIYEHATISLSINNKLTKLELEALELLKSINLMINSKENSAESLKNVHEKLRTLVTELETSFNENINQLERKISTKEIVNDRIAKSIESTKFQAKAMKTGNVALGAVQIASLITELWVKRWNVPMGFLGMEKEIGIQALLSSDPEKERFKSSTEICSLINDSISGSIVKRILEGQTSIIFDFILEKTREKKRNSYRIDPYNPEYTTR